MKETAEILYAKHIIRPSCTELNIVEERHEGFTSRGI